MTCLKKAWLAALLLVSLLAGCSHPPEPRPPYRVVTSVSVTASHNAQIRHFHYTQPEKVRTMLNYLRRMDTYAPVPIAPDTFRGDAFRIVLHRSDGTELVYHQIADGFLQKGNGSWEKTDTRHASTLLRLLEDMPGDTP